MTVVLKLGGSVVTDKDTPETVDWEALGEVAAAIADHATGGDEDLVVVHGGGSFGHHYASEYGVSRTAGTRDARGVRAIHDAMKALNDAVIDALQERDVPALPVHPLSVGFRGADEALSFPVAQVDAMLGEGFVPVLHGDVVTHVGAGATILSGDELVVTLAAGIDADRVGLCSAVPGVLDDEGRVVDRIRSFDDVAAFLGESDSTDVTGGMAAKVRELLALGSPAYVFDREAVAAFLAGEGPGTRIG